MTGEISELPSPCSPCSLCSLCSPAASEPCTPCVMSIKSSPVAPDANDPAAADAPGRRRGGRPDRVLGVFSRMASLTWLRLKPVIWQIRALGRPASKKSVRARRRSASVRCFVPMAAEGDTRARSKLEGEGGQSRRESVEAGAWAGRTPGKWPSADDGQSRQAQSSKSDAQQTARHSGRRAGRRRR